MRGDEALYRLNDCGGERSSPGNHGGVDPQFHDAPDLPGAPCRFRHLASAGSVATGCGTLHALMNIARLRRAFTMFAAVFALAVGGCGGGGGGGTALPLVGPLTPVKDVPNKPLGSDAIEHVVVIIQENRSFDNFFHGFPGADSATSGASHHGPVTLMPVDLNSRNDIGHEHESFATEYDGGRLDGFDSVVIYALPKYPPPHGQLFPYGYVPQDQIAPYWTLASQYVLADRTFQSNSGPSFPAHQYLIAGQSDNIPDGPSKSPWGCDAPPGTTETQITQNGLIPGPFPCFSYATLGNELDAKGLEWRFYAPLIHAPGGVFSAYDAIRDIRYGPDWHRKVKSPETRVLDDIAAGYLAPVTWIVPSAIDSDHSGTHSSRGPNWVASVVNAIGTSQYWNSTAIFVIWDDWGGWYDHVVPPQYDLMGLGFRVPLLVVSPWAKHGYVSHVQHESASILKFIEDDFGLPSLGQADARADSLIDCFDFSQKPAPFQPLRTRYHASDFANQPDDPPDIDR